MCGYMFYCVLRIYNVLFALKGALNDVWGYTEPYLLAVWQNRLYVYTTAAVLIGLWFTVNVAFRKVMCSVFLTWHSWLVAAFNIFSCLLWCHGLFVFFCRRKWSMHSFITLRRNRSCHLKQRRSFTSLGSKYFMDPRLELQRFATEMFSGCHVPTSVKNTSYKCMPICYVVNVMFITLRRGLPESLLKTSRARGSSVKSQTWKNMTRMTGWQRRWAQRVWWKVCEPHTLNLQYYFLIIFFSNSIF